MNNPHRYMPLLFVFRSGPLLAWRSDMRSDTIDFISAYCDRWCERRAFTDRCSAFACNAAIAMCGDTAEGIELAVGRARSPEDAAGGGGSLEESVNQVPSAEEMAEFRRLEDERQARVDASPIAQMSRRFMNRAVEWIDGHRSLDEHADAIVRETFQIACWDTYLIHVKLCRALSGRDRRRHAEEHVDDHPVQNDWNGTAKVAMISIARSRDAWSAVGSALADASATALGDRLGHLHGFVLNGFPNATEFRRPGFDDPSGGEYASDI